MDDKGRLLLVHVELRPGTRDRVMEIGMFLREKIAFFGEHCLAYTSAGADVMGFVLRTKETQKKIMASLEGRTGAPGLRGTDQAAIFEITDDSTLLNKGSLLAWMQHH